MPTGGYTGRRWGVQSVLERRHQVRQTWNKPAEKLGHDCLQTGNRFTLLLFYNNYSDFSIHQLDPARIMWSLSMVWLVYSASCWYGLIMNSSVQCQGHLHVWLGWTCPTCWVVSNAERVVLLAHTSTFICPSHQPNSDWCLKDWTILCYYNNQWLAEDGWTHWVKVWKVPQNRISLILFDIAVF